jgi:hypothetical protein
MKTAAAQLKEDRFGGPLSGTSKPTVFVADGFDLPEFEPTANEPI